MKNLIYIFTVIAVFSCSPPETDSDICIDNMVEMLDMEHYSGVIEGECRDYLRWFTYDGNDYFMLDNPCADMVLHLWDCDKVDVCVDFSEECQTILADKTDQGLVGRGEK